jgi:hypothetical protein
VRVRIASLLCSLALAGCAPPAGTQRVWLPAYALGAIGGGELDVRDYCPPGTLREISEGSSFGTLGISLLTLGVYTPREVRIRCRCAP